MNRKQKNSLKGQLEMDLTIVAEVEADGVGMGVLSNGAPYLTGRGLGRLCGVDHSTIIKLTNEWQETPVKPRVATIKKYIRDLGGDDGSLFIALQKGGVFHHAYTEKACMAVLEYYAMDSVSKNDHARHAYRTLARKGFNDFVYEQVGLERTPSTKDLSTKQFIDRVKLVNGAVPIGYFCIFQEIADMFATLIAKDIQIDSSFVPDVSVGQTWSRHWKTENLDAVYGMRSEFDHQYPEYYPQSAAGPQPAFCYPEEALSEFRQWMREHYHTDKLPAYLSRKVKQGSIEKEKATAITNAYKPVQIPKQ